MLKKISVSVALLLVMLGGVVSAQPGGPRTVSQWASTATASSEYTSNDYSAQQATGEPDALECGDSIHAWASLESGTVETITLYYNEPVQARQINIYMNYNPGTITSVSLLTPDGSPVEIPDSASTDTTCPGVFTLDISRDFGDEFFTNGVQIEIDQSSIDDWTEIDAVELVGVSLNGLSQDEIDAAAASASASTSSSSSSTSTVSVPDGPIGEPIYCDGNLVAENGVVVTVVQMRPNSNYTATVIGLNGFDPILAVRDAASGDGLCNDDNPDASYYSANLPTTGPVEPSRLTSSQTFNTFNYSNMANIELVVGGYNSQPGEFVLILEGMLLSQADGAGDPLSIGITPGMVLSGVNPSVYMFSVVQSMDPLIALIDSDYNFIVDGNGATVYCDDAGNASSCWGESTSLRNSFVSRSQGRTLSGINTDAMLTLPIDADSIGFAYTPIMRSYEMRTFGDYVVAFHVGIGAREE